MLVSSRIMQIIVFSGFLMALYKNCQIIWKPDKLQSHKIGLGVICLLDIELDVTVHKSFVWTSLNTIIVAAPFISISYPYWTVT